MRRRTRRPILVLALATLATACVREPDPFTVDADDVSVHFILEAGADSVLAVVEAPRDPVEDAVVRLIRGADTTTLAYDAASCLAWFETPTGGCHRAMLTEPVAADAAYELEIVLPDGSRITGRTTVPRALQPTSPAPAARVVARCNDPAYCHAESLDVPPYFVPVAEIVIRWESAVERERLFGFVRPVRTWLDGVAYERDPGSLEDQGCELGFFDVVFGAGAMRITEDSLELMIPNIQCFGAILEPARFDSIHVEAVVQYQNAEYAEYLEAMREFGGSSRASHLSLGLDGAWGVFGAFTPTVLPVTIVRDPEPGPAPSCPPTC